MKKLILISALLLVASNGWAYSETDLAKLKATNACEGCDLSGANLSFANLVGANLSEANLVGANLRKANLSEANLSEANLTGVKFGDATMILVKMYNS